MQEPTDETIHCNNCGNDWPEEELDQIHDYWGRVSPGDIMPIGQCPEAECGALCSPPYGYAHDLEEQCRVMRDVLSRLLDWAAFLGGFDAPVWKDVRRLLAQPQHGNPNEEEA